MMVQGTGGGWAGSCHVRVGSTSGRWLLNRQEGVPQPGRDLGISAPQLRELLPPPGAQRIQAALSCGSTGTATLAPAVGHGRAGTATPDVTHSCSYLDEALQPPGPGHWGTVVADELGHIWSLPGRGQQRALTGSSACFLLASLEPVVQTQCCSGEWVSLAGFTNWVCSSTGLQAAPRNYQLCRLFPARLS